MAAIGTVLMGKVLGHSDAEKAFRPWWDSLEDTLIYGLVMLGVIIVPTAIIMTTPLDCNYCQSNYCEDSKSRDSQADPFNNQVKGKEDPGFNMWWVRKYCTVNGSVDPFMLYFPYFLLGIALSLFFIERVFLKAFKAGSKLEKFYALIESENVLGTQSSVTDATVDGGKEAIELRQSFRGSQSYFLSYLLRTILEIIVAAVLLFYMTWKGLPVLDHADTLICDVHSFYYECSGQPAQFYLYILYITCTITALYILCNIYNLLWLLVPRLGKLSNLMSTYKNKMRARDTSNSKTDKELLGDLYDIYYGNRDLRLLLDLLATSSGVSSAIAIMTLFDKNFRDAMKPHIHYISASRDLGIVEIQFQEPKTGVRAALDDIHGVHLLYVAEIVPPAKTAVEAFESKYEYEYEAENNGLNDDCCNNEGGTALRTRGFIKRACFQGLKKEVTYTLKVSTVVNGKTICQVSEEVEAHHEKLPPDDAAKPVVNEKGEVVTSCNILGTC